MIDAKSNYAAQQLNDIFAKRKWHTIGKIHAYATDQPHEVQIQWRHEGCAEVVVADPLALLRWMDAGTRRWADLEKILIKKLEAGQVPQHTPRQQTFTL